MPRKKVTKSPPAARSDCEDDDYFFDDSQSNSGRSSQEPVHRNAANARERARMRVLSKAFCRLKTTLPWVPADTKLSKLDTLRLAASYIAHLRALLADECPPQGPHPLNLAWPFAFQHGGTISCSISSRWSHHQPGESPPQTDIQQNEQRNYPEAFEQYQNYDKRFEEEVVPDAPCDTPVQYSNNNYNYNKEQYYELRNMY